MRWLLALAALLTLAVTLASASLRLSQGGAGCTPWPACKALVVQARIAGQDTVAPAWHEGVRLAHRVSASAAGLLYLFIVLFGWSAWSLGERVAGLTLLADSGLLAALGRVTPSEHAGVVLGNLLGGFALLAALGWLISARATAARPPPLPGSADGASGGATGRAVNAGRALVLACALLAACASGALLGHAIAWSPEAPAPLPGFDAAPGIGWAHGSAAAAALAIGFAIAMRPGGAAARVGAGVLAAGALLGVALWWRGGESLLLALGHNLAAALAVAAGAWVAAACALRRD